MSAPIPMSSAVRPAMRSQVRILVAKRWARMFIGGSPFGLAEREYVRLDPGLEERDLEGVLADLSGLTDELIQAPIVSGALAALVDVDAVCGARLRSPSTRTRNGTGCPSCAGPMTRLTSRARNRYASDPPASFSRARLSRRSSTRRREPSC